MEKYCQNCNKPNPPDAAFCRHCASNQFHPIQAQQQQPFQPQQQAANPGWEPPAAVPMQAVNFTGPSGGASGRAMAALGLAAAGLFCCGFFTGIPAAIIGWLEISAIKEGKSSPNGMWMAQVGLWGGIAGSIINGIVTLLLFFMMSLR